MAEQTWQDRYDEMEERQNKLFARWDALLEAFSQTYNVSLSSLHGAANSVDAPSETDDGSDVVISTLLPFDETLPKSESLNSPEASSGNGNSIVDSVSDYVFNTDLDWCVGSDVVSDPKEHYSTPMTTVFSKQHEGDESSEACEPPPKKEAHPFQFGFEVTMEKKSPISCTRVAIARLELMHEGTLSGGWCTLEPLRAALGWKYISDVRQHYQTRPLPSPPPQPPDHSFQKTIVGFKTTEEPTMLLQPPDRNVFVEIPQRNMVSKTNPPLPFQAVATKPMFFNTLSKLPSPEPPDEAVILRLLWEPLLLKLDIEIFPMHTAEFWVASATCPRAVWKNDRVQSVEISIVICTRLLPFMSCRSVWSVRHHWEKEEKQVILIQIDTTSVIQFHKYRNCSNCDPSSGLGLEFDDNHACLSSGIHSNSNGSCCCYDAESNFYGCQPEFPLVFSSIHEKNELHILHLLTFLVVNIIGLEGKRQAHVSVHHFAMINRVLLLDCKAMSMQHNCDDFSGNHKAYSSYVHLELEICVNAKLSFHPDRSIMTLGHDSGENALLSAQPSSPIWWEIVGDFVALCGASNFIFWTFPIHSKASATILPNAKVSCVIVLCLIVLGLVRNIIDMLSVNTCELFLIHKTEELAKEMTLVLTQGKIGQHVRMLPLDIKSSPAMCTVLKIILVEMGEFLPLEKHVQNQDKLMMQQMVFGLAQQEANWALHTLNDFLVGMVHATSGILAFDCHFMELQFVWLPVTDVGSIYSNLVLRHLANVSASWLGSRYTELANIESKGYMFKYSPGGYFWTPKTIFSSQFKHWDPGKFVPTTMNSNLEDKVVFDGEGNVMNQQGAEPLPISGSQATEGC